MEHAQQATRLPGANWDIKVLAVGAAIELVIRNKGCMGLEAGRARGVTTDVVCTYPKPSGHN